MHSTCTCHNVKKNRTDSDTKAADSDSDQEVETESDASDNEESTKKYKSIRQSIITSSKHANFKRLMKSKSYWEPDLEFARTLGKSCWHKLTGRGGIAQRDQNTIMCGTSGNTAKSATADHIVGVFPDREMVFEVRPLYTN